MKNDNKYAISFKVKDLEEVNYIIKDCGGILKNVFAPTKTVFVSLKLGENPDEVLTKYQNHPNVIHANFDAFIEPRANLNLGSNDQYMDQCWNLFLLGVWDAWHYTTGQGVRLGIADTGVGHPDLELTGGYNINSPDYECISDAGFEPGRFIPHGTSCAGLMCAKRNNNIGGAGVAPDVSELWVGAIGNLCTVGVGGSVQDWWAGTYVVIDPIDGFGCKLINMSFGWYFDYGIWEDLMAYMWEVGAIGIVAANNDQRLVDYEDWPGIYPNAVLVGSANEDFSKSQYSGYGKLDCIAYGYVFTVKGGIDMGYYQTDTPDWLSKNTTLWGNSFAAPQITGIAALIWSVDLNFTNQQVRDILTSSYVRPLKESNFYEWCTRAKGIANAAIAVKKARVLSSSYTGEIYPHLNFVSGGQGPSTLGYAVDVEFVNDQPIVSLDGTVIIDITGYADRPILENELWLGEELVYKGPPCRLYLTCSSQNTPRKVKVVASTFDDSYFEEYDDINVSDISIQSIENVEYPKPNTVWKGTPKSIKDFYGNDVHLKTWHEDIYE